jgi:predicted ATPase
VTVAARLIGRERDRERLGALIRANAVVSVIGAGGVGKTALVSALLDDPRVRERWEVHVGWLAALPRGSGADEIARCIGYESANALRLVLSDAAVLIVLDNCEHVLEGVCDLLALRSSTSAGCVVTTSRAPIELRGEHVMVIQPLALADEVGADADRSPAVQLFVERAAEAGAALDTSPRGLVAIATLCRRLDGLPLAIELAAARARSLSPLELLELVEDRIDGLRRRQGGRGRHDSMRAAIQVSVEMLDDAERAWFRRLAVFAGPFELGLAHAVAAADGEHRVAASEIVSSLADRSLLVVERRGAALHYRLLEVLRTHANRLLDDTGERDQVEARFVDAMVATADAVVASAVAAWTEDVLHAATSQFSNLRRACELCIERDEGPERAFRLMLPMFATLHHGRADDVLRIGGRVIARWGDAGAPLRAEALSILASAGALEGRRDDVVQFAQAVLDDERATPVAVAVTERALGLALGGRDPAVALGHFRRAGDTARHVGFSALAREADAFAAGQLDLAGDTIGALEAITALVAAARDAADPVVETLAWLTRCGILLRAGRPEDAEAALAAAESASDRTGAEWWTGAMRRSKALVAAAGDDGWARSAPLWRAALDFAVAAGAVGEIAITLRTAAATADHLGHRDVAEELAATVPASGGITVLTQSFPPDLHGRVERLGVTRRTADPVDSVRRAREILDRCGESPSVAATRDANPRPSDRGGDVADHELVREGDVWRIRFRGRDLRIKHLKGLEDLAVLLGRPGVEVHVVELAGAGVSAGTAGPALDDRARREYQRRIVELQQDVDEARVDHDPMRAERAEAELDALVEELSSAFGLGGRARTTGSTVERARTAVTYRIRAAVKRLVDADEELGRHLTNAVRTGSWCSYRPESAVTWRVDRGVRRR